MLVRNILSTDFSAEVTIQRNNIAHVAQGGEDASVSSCQFQTGEIPLKVPFSKVLQNWDYFKFKYLFIFKTFYRIAKHLLIVICRQRHFDSND